MIHCTPSSDSSLVSSCVCALRVSAPAALGGFPDVCFSAPTCRGARTQLDARPAPSRLGWRILEEVLCTPFILRGWRDEVRGTPLSWRR